MENHEIYTQIIKSVSEGVVVYDKDLKYLLWNPFMEKFTGLKESDVLGKHPSDLFPFLATEGVIKSIQKVLNGESTQNIDFQFKIPSTGVMGWASEKTSPLFDSENKIIGAISTVRDITDQILAEYKLSESESKYKVLFEKANDAIFLMEKEIFIDCNLKTLEMFGCKREEIIGQPPYLFSPEFQPDGRNSKDKAIEKILGAISGENQFFEWKHNRLDGTLFDAEVSLSNVHFADKDFLLAIVRDITDRKSSELQLKEKEENLRVILESTDDGILAVGKDNQVLSYNRRFIELWKIPKAIISSEDDKELLDYVMDQLADPDSFIQKIIMLYNSMQTDYDTINFKDSRIFERLSNPLVLDGKNVGRVWSFRDITDKKLAEKALKESEYFFKESQRAAAIGSYKTDFVLGFWESSEVLDQIFGIGLDYDRSIEGWMEIVHPDDKEMMVNYLTEEVLDKHKPFNKEYRIIRKSDGEVRWVLGLGAIFIDDQDNVTSLIGTIQDITERKQAEEALIQAKEAAENSEKLKTVFLQNMSHEIRTPLNGILGFSDILSNPDISSEQTIEYTNIIQQSSKKLLEIISDILDVSKLETEQMLVKKQVFSLNDTIDQLQNFFSQNAGQKGLILSKKNYFEKEFSFIESDKTKINQILTNLINNAIKFTNQGSVEFGYNVKENELLFYVKDTGIGIDNEIGERVFDRFYHYESSGATEYEGFGLGLSICRGLINLLGGNIWYDSEIGKGTTFYFSIPYIQAQAIEDTHTDEITKNEYSKPRKILIADDNYISYKYLYEVLKKENTTILYAKNGEQAVEIVKDTDDIDIVLMDMRMPVMDGKSATEIIKKIRPKLPVIANTAYAFSNESDIMQNLGFNDYISKPVEKVELFNLIEKHLNV